MSPALLTLIALTVIAFGLIVALLLKIRADRVYAQPEQAKAEADE